MKLDIKKLLCHNFCDGITVSEIDGVLNVSTPFEIGSGDTISFYISQLDSDTYRIEDDGSIVPTMLATGVNILEGTRKQDFDRILSKASISYNQEIGELHSNAVTSGELPFAAFKFIDTLIKLDAIKTPLRPDKVASMFKQDVRSKVDTTFKGKVIIEYDSPLSPELVDFTPDIILRKDGEKPLVLYVLTNDQRAWEAIALRSTAIYEKRIECSVTAIFDKVRSKLVAQKSVVSVNNHLDATPYFYDDENGAMSRIASEINLSIQSTSIH